MFSYGRREIALSDAPYELVASADFLGKSQRGLYGDVIEEIDWNVGRILEAIKKWSSMARAKLEDYDRIGEEQRFFDNAPKRPDLLVIQP